MSHFAVLVIGEDHETQLAPYHEFECTGHDDEFVQDIDETEDKRSEYEAGTKTQLQDENGGYHDPHTDSCYRDPTEEEKPKVGMGHGFGEGLSWYSKDWGDGLGYRAKVHFTPEGFKEVEVRYKDLMTFAEYVKREEGNRVIHEGEPIDTTNKDFKYGYVLMNKDETEVIKVIRRTNPDAKWDWYQLGGRWHGFFRLKPGSIGELGEKSWTLEKEKTPKNTASSAFKKDIDFDGMRDEAGTKARDTYILFQRFMGGSIPKIDIRWKSLCDGEQYKTMGWEEQRNLYHSQPALIKMKELQDKIRATKAMEANLFTIEELDKLCWLDLEDFQCTEEEYVKRARNNATCTFAVVKDGKWYQRGEMGWWGCVSDEKDKDAWLEEFAKLVDDLPGDTRLSIVDCHI